MIYRWHFYIYDQVVIEYKLMYDLWYIYQVFGGDGQLYSV